FGSQNDHQNISKYLEIFRIHMKILSVALAETFKVALHIIQMLDYSGDIGEVSKTAELIIDPNQFSIPIYAATFLTPPSFWNFCIIFTIPSTLLTITISFAQASL
uniref:Uncharacterized protein n=1 Tax=Xenopus tropicalis TaxID=8364 RepID=A0A803K102_XENTR